MDFRERPFVHLYFQSQNIYPGNYSLVLYAYLFRSTLLTLSSSVFVIPILLVFLAMVTFHWLLIFGVSTFKTFCPSHNWSTTPPSQSQLPFPLCSSSLKEVLLIRVITL